MGVGQRARGSTEAIVAAAHALGKCSKPRGWKSVNANDSWRPLVPPWLPPWLPLLGPTIVPPSRASFHTSRAGSTAMRPLATGDFTVTSTAPCDKPAASTAALPVGER